MTEQQLLAPGESGSVTREDVLDRLEDDAIDAYERQEAAIGPENIREWERYVLLQVVDLHWREHLYAMDYLREGIHLRALAQLDPLSSYRTEGHEMFDEMMKETMRPKRRSTFPSNCATKWRASKFRANARPAPYRCSTNDGSGAASDS